MAKSSIFICQQCGANSPKWSGKCAACDAWGSITEEIAESSAVKGKSRAASRPTEVLDTITLDENQNRLDTGDREVNQVLGGGIVPGSLLLLAGEPGIGKSTLLLQVAAAISRDHEVLYVSGEESLQQLKLRAERLGVQSQKLRVLAATDIDEIAATVRELGVKFVIVDSVQTMSTGRITSSPGTVSQITTCTHILQETAKQTRTAIMVVGHVTKEGNIAGPKVLEHLVDVVLHLEGERFGGFKLLRGVKNRFGSTHEVGVFEMQSTGMVAVDNPSASLLQERHPGNGSVVLATMEGTRALLVEVQALVNTSPFGYPKRTSVGFDTNRLNVLIAVLNQRAGLRLGDKDVYVNVVGGMKLQEPAADLAIALAIASAALKRPVEKAAVVFGEVGLSGEVRSVPHTETRIKEAKKMKFQSAIAPRTDSKFVMSTPTLSDAIKHGLSAEKA